MTRDELRELLAKTADDNGRVTPEGVVEEARKESSPLNKLPGFCWDNDAAAAQLHRLAYASTLIRKVYVTRRTVEKRRARVPYYIRDPKADVNVKGHVPLEKVDTSADAQAIAHEEVRRVVGILRRTLAVVAALSMPDAATRLEQLLGAAVRLQTRLAPEEEDEAAA